MSQKLQHIIIVLFWAMILPGISEGNQDSLQVLSFNKYMSWVKKHHPLARQANLTLEKGQARLLNARGGFDPKAIFDLSQKQFDDKEYYSLLNGGFKVPTWFGLELKAGYEMNQGNFLNPENNTPESGLYYAGISVPVGQGLFIDKRRAELRKAQVYIEMTEVQQKSMLNELLYDAGKAYWNWFMAYANYQVLLEAVELAETRFNAIRSEASLGSRPSIDTLEAGIQVQNRHLNLKETELNYKNALLNMSVFLWQDGLIPLEPENNTIPETLDQINSTLAETNIPDELDSLVRDHPDLLQYQFMLEQFEIDKRWKKEQLKPVLNLKYNAISEANNSTESSSFSLNNYTWGLEFSIPIFLRKERGDVKLAEIKIQETEYKIENKRALILTKINTAINEWYITKDQAELYNNTIRDYGRLLEGERQMFRSGESSLFMVNSRETGYINAQIKLIELLSKNRKAALKTDFTLGQLSDVHSSEAYQF